MPFHLTAVAAGLLLIAARVSLAEAPGSQSRPWTDKSGKFEVHAELISIDRESRTVKLRREDGKEFQVPIARLSSADRRYLRTEHERGPRGAGGERLDRRELATAAKRFFLGLRAADRAPAAALLTKDAQQAATARSPLADLPSPDPRGGSIRIGDVAAGEDGGATVDVRVKVGGEPIPTRLFFKREADEWRVFALSATLPSGEQRIDFEGGAATSGAGGDRPDGPLAGLIGKPMPLRGLMANGRTFDIQQLQGKLVLVEFWATWCGPCIEELPNIAENYVKYRERGFEVVAVSLDRDMQALSAFLAQHPTPWVVLADKHPKNPVSMAELYGVSKTPSMLLVGPDGRVLASGARGARLSRELEQYFAEGRPPGAASAGADGEQPTGRAAVGPGRRVRTSAQR